MYQLSVCIFFFVGVVVVVTCPASFENLSHVFDAPSEVEYNFQIQRFVFEIYLFL